MAPQILRSFWSRIRPPKDDPYEEFFLHAAPADPRNDIVRRMRLAPEGSVFAVKAETHTPEIMSSHIKELGRFFGAALTCIVDARGLTRAGDTPDREDGDSEELPYAIFCFFRSEHDPREAPGTGGHVAALHGAFATFQISAIIREYGFHASRATGLDAGAAAAVAGLGTLDAEGRLHTPRFGTKVHVADVILTDLPVETDQP